MMTNPEKIKRLYEILEKVETYSRVIGKMNFDMECCAPEEGLEQAGLDMAMLETQVHDWTHNEEYFALITGLNADREGLSPLENRLIDLLYDGYLREKNVSADFAYRRSLAYNNAYAKWLEAKKKNDFSVFRDSFAELIDFTRAGIDLYDTKPTSYYNACLDVLEKGMTEEKLDAFFAAVKARTVPLLARIVKEGKPIRRDFLTRKVPVPLQEKMSRAILREEGLRESALSLMTTEHPFTDNYGPHDVRVTTHYYEDAFVSNVFSTLHEGGHALFMQNEPAEFCRNHIYGEMTNAMHECVSRFYENLIGRSRAFIHSFYPTFREVGGDVFADVTENELYEAVNIAEPSLIRMEADELTYSLHIMIRYEIEKAFVNGDITVDEVPALWNEKYKEYLGVDVPDDANGCLQDVHWSGSYGYFPSYALGNAYGAQILATMKKDFDVDAAVAGGELTKVTDWMTKHVFNCASSQDPDAWIREITGEDLNPDYFLDYLEEKYTALYGLK